MSPTIPPPTKPFPGYKWRWAVFTPTEELNNPAVYLGVLRALRKCEGKAKSSPEINALLRVVQKETKTTVDLIRGTERNLFRNSGQYWKALNLLGDKRGVISLTDFGRRLADGGITKSEFAATIIKTLELPNRNIQTDVSDWDAVKLKIKPLELILQILSELQEVLGKEQGYITPEELIKIVIPLAGDKAPTRVYLDSIAQYRKGLLDLSDWPDCVPKDNDKRMAREFILFLGYYGFLNIIKGDNRYVDKYYLADFTRDEVRPFLEMGVGAIDPIRNLDKVRESNIPAIADRKKVQRELLSRPQQRIFRKNVLLSYGTKCLITGVGLQEVLEASHIKPVSPPHNGNDKIENGLCLRSDIHSLFDSGHLRLDPSGSVYLSEEASKEVNYTVLPKKITIPPFVNSDYVEWRWKYY